MLAYKIYFGEVQILIISGEPDHFIGKKVHIYKPPYREANEVIYLIKEHKLEENVCFITANPDHLFKYFKTMFEYRKAAGGIVKNEAGQLLFIYKYYKWDLPKGGIDAGEDEQTAAIREVREECGLERLEMIRKIGATYHIGRVNNNLILKKTVWFEILCRDPENIKPQTEEGISEAKWVTLDKEHEILQQTYNSIRDLIQKYTSHENQRKK
jgi:8-oxo-dGTP pyrophosphatase MutT (NUDIX family)